MERPSPLAPDGLPVIGRVSAFDNLLIATGHGMLGVTLAHVTGRLIAAPLTGDEPCVDTAAFSPDRFAARRSSKREAGTAPPTATDKRGQNTPNQTTEGGRR